MDTVPGRIQAENYINYSDTTPGNAGGRFRADSVDIETTSDTGGGYNVGWIAGGEWLEYAINVTQAGTYQLDARVASLPGSGAFTLQIGGSTLGNSLTVNATGAWQNWTTVSTNIGALTAGNKTLRIQVQSGNFNINWLELKKVGGNTVWTNCAAENQLCSFSGSKRVRYGEGSKWREDVFINSAPCNNATFGDPVPNTFKTCQTAPFALPAEARPTPVDVQKNLVRFVYFVEKGQTFNTAHYRAIAQQAFAFQNYWFTQFDGTFYLYDKAVDVIYGDNDSAWYVNNPDGANTDPRWYRLENIKNEVHRKLGLAAYDPKVRIVNYPTTRADGRVGANYGGAWMDGDDLTCLVGDNGGYNFPYPDQYAAHCTGHVAHEFGHIFGLDHAGPQNDCMQYGFYIYSDDGKLCNFFDSNKNIVKSNSDNVGWLVAKPNQVITSLGVVESR